MSNNKDFKVKNGIKPTVYHEAVGTVVSGSEGYYLEGASYDSKSFSVASQETTARGVNFKSDGTKMYVIGSVSDTVFQYSLSTAWDVSTASYDSVSFSVTAQDGAPMCITFKPDGTKFYIAGNNTSSVYQYTLSTAWDMSTASYDSISFSVSTQGIYSREVIFNDDGTLMYVYSSNNETIFQYTLSTAWDISTASYASKSYAFGNTPESDPEGMAFNDTGTKFYMVGTGGDTVYQYTLSTAWDISTLSYDSVSFSVAGQDTTPYGVLFGNSGKKMYVTGSLTDTIYQYSTAQNTATLDLSTGSVFEITPTSDITVSLSNPAASGTVSGATLLLSASGTAYTITYDTAIQWAGGTAPTSPAIGETDVVTFSTRDGGTTYSAALAIDGAQ